MRDTITAERFYRAALGLFPARFQVRFGPEMAQVFMDSWRVNAARGLFSVVSFWVRTFHDLAASIVREWHREIDRVDSEIDFPGLADSFMIAIVVGTNLVFWGWTGSLFTLSALRLNQPTIALAGIVAVLVAVALAVGSATFVARYARTDRPRIKV